MRRDVHISDVLGACVELGQRGCPLNRWLQDCGLIHRGSTVLAIIDHLDVQGALNGGVLGRKRGHERIHDLEVALADVLGQIDLHLGDDLCQSFTWGDFVSIHELEHADQGILSLETSIT